MTEGRSGELELGVVGGPSRVDRKWKVATVARASALGLRNVPMHEDFAIDVRRKDGTGE